MQNDKAKFKNGLVKGLHGLTLKEKIILYFDM